MSRTYGHGTGDRWNGRKHPSYEYWSRRAYILPPGKESKRLTHRIERRKEREIISEELRCVEKN